MEPDGPNPVQIQTCPPNKLADEPLPLVLLHDGGGTTFSYFFLDHLDRDVWALHNPNFFTGEPFAGGMDAMARHYIELIAKAGISGKILIGGWSLGGYLSVAIAKILAQEPSSFSIAGMLLIDSPYHSPDAPEGADPVMGNIPDLVQKAFDNCIAMLKDWHLPEWPAAQPSQDIQLTVSGRSFAVNKGEILYAPHKGTWTTRAVETYPDTQSQRAPQNPPLAALMRCVDAAPVQAGAGAGNVCDVDFDRDQVLLGWAGKYPDFIRAVADLQGHHYALFEVDKADYVTSRMRELLQMLENAARK